MISGGNRSNREQFHTSDSQEGQGSGVKLYSEYTETKSQSHRVLSVQEMTGGSIHPHNLKQEAAAQQRSPVWSPTLPLPRLPDAAGHCSDKSCSLPTAVLGLQERHIAFRSQISHGLMHDFGKAGKRERRDVTGSCPPRKLERGMKMRNRTANTDWLLGAGKGSLEGHVLVLQSGQSREWKVQVWHKCLERLVNFFSK